jgi:HTH-type transcriptional regulator/antitoxin HipB
MQKTDEKLPIGNIQEIGPSIVRSTQALGELIRARRKQLELKQTDVAGIGNTGNRFIVDVENGKPTVQLQKVMNLLELLGLELTVRPKDGGTGGRL